MAQPVAYNRSALYGETYFTDWTASHPSDPPQGNKLDGEFNAVAKSISQHAFNLALLQRDDGGLANGIVTPDSLNDDLYGGLNPLGLWVTGTIYSARDGVVNGSTFYRHADTTHTAGATFVGDLAYWTELYDFADVNALALLSFAQPAAQANGAAGTVGSAVVAARGDHQHAQPTILTSAAATTMSTAGSTVGTATLAARADHQHGYDTVHAALVPIAAAASTFPYFTSASVATVGALTAAALTVLDDTTTTAMLTTLGAPGLALSNTFSAKNKFAGSATDFASWIANAVEPVQVTNAAATGTINYDITTRSGVYYTGNASGNWTLNLRGSASVSIGAILAVEEMITVVHAVTQGATPYYNNVVQVEGTVSGVTTKWLGVAPGAGNASGIDVYAYTIMKTAAGTYTVLASQSPFV